MPIIYGQYKGKKYPADQPMPEPKGKVCTKCHTLKPIDCYWRDCAHSDGRDTICIDCRKSSKRKG